MPKKGTKTVAKKGSSPTGSAPVSPQLAPAAEPASPAKVKSPKGSPKSSPKNSPKKAPVKADPVPAPLATPVEEGPLDPASSDLTLKMTPFLDRHLVIRLMAFVAESGMYKQEDLDAAELHLLKGTRMIDYAVEKFGDKADDLAANRDEIIAELLECRNKVMPLLEMLEDDEEVKRIQNFKSLEELCEGIKMDRSVIEAVPKYAKMQYECGNYGVSGDLLQHYRRMIQQDATIGSAQLARCSWGALACFLLNSKYEDAADTIFKIDEYLETAKMSKREVLLHKTWLLHWTLFAIFHEEKLEANQMKLLDFFLNEKSLSIISLSCPHLFRYVGACLILHKRLKHLVKDTVWIINHEVGSYSDPITRLLLALYSDMDFDEAQRMLQQCEPLCKGDYFLGPKWVELQENARLLIFETYCRIHQCINIDMIATKLNMTAEAAELWIVKLIQNAKLDARIDSERSRVVMSKAPASVYQQVIEKTKNMSFRSTMLLSNLEKKEKGQLMT